MYRKACFYVYLVFIWLIVVVQSRALQKLNNFNKNNDLCDIIKIKVAV